MLFDGHGDVWTDVTCKRVDNHETDIFRKYHLKKFQAGKVTGGIFVIWIDLHTTKTLLLALNRLFRASRKR